ncbi:membrane protein insertion efficiency factor YidD [Actinoplanes sp. NPDC051633]|uniref:membrane protein insertion efficiency factor YidD n=1 Tax=Actinoplanes sp. NPDC051633 TaxID=3155670 RepID=UPI003434B3C3
MRSYIRLPKRHHRRPHRKRRKGKWYDGCDFCDCDLPCCDFGLLSTSMLLAARTPLPQRATASLIKGYRRVLSPRVPVKCRFTPSCSEFGLEAVTLLGTRRGLRVTAARLRRCRPGVPYGTFDPVRNHIG